LLLAGAQLAVALAGSHPSGADANARGVGYLPQAAKAFVPAGGQLVVAQQMDASFGVVSYRTPTRTRAVAVRWHAGAWRRLPGTSIRFLSVNPGRDAKISERVSLVTASIRSPDTLVLGGMWIDGTMVRPLPSGSDGFTSLVEDLANGRHVVTVFAATKTAAAASAWSFFVR
jgi:hypothetical protein